MTYLDWFVNDLGRMGATSSFDTYCTPTPRQHYASNRGVPLAHPVLVEVAPQLLQLWFLGRAVELAIQVSDGYPFHVPQTCHAVLFSTVDR